MSHSGRRGVNFSHYLRNLNVQEPAVEETLITDEDLAKDLALFTNTQFYDFETGQNTDYQAPPVKPEATQTQSPAEDVTSADPMMGDFAAGYDFMSGGFVPILLLLDLPAKFLALFLPFGSPRVRSIQPSTVNTMNVSSSGAKLQWTGYGNNRSAARRAHRSGTVFKLDAQQDNLDIKLQWGGRAADQTEGASLSRIGECVRTPLRPACAHGWAAP